MSISLFELILALKGRCQAKEEEIREEYGLSQAEFNALLAIKPGESIHAHLYAERMGLSPSRTSRVLTDMVAREYCAMNTPPENRRSVLVSLTPRGVTMQENIFRQMRACEEQILAGFSSGQQTKIKEALQLLIQNM